MPHCSEFVEQVTAVEEGAAPRRLWLGFHLHRLACSRCRRYLRQMRALRGALGRQAASDVPVDPLSSQEGEAPAAPPGPSRGVHRR
jgi:hypothetical protein